MQFSNRIKFNNAIMQKLLFKFHPKSLFYKKIKLALINYKNSLCSNFYYLTSFISKMCKSSAVLQKYLRENKLPASIEEVIREPMATIKTLGELYKLQDELQKDACEVCTLNLAQMYQNSSLRHCESISKEAFAKQSNNKLEKLLSHAKNVENFSLHIIEDCSTNLKKCQISQLLEKTSHQLEQKKNIVSPNQKLAFVAILDKNLIELAQQFNLCIKCTEQIETLQRFDPKYMEKYINSPKEALKNLTRKNVSKAYLQYGWFFQKNIKQCKRQENNDKRRLKYDDLGDGNEDLISQPSSSQERQEMQQKQRYFQRQQSSSIALKREIDINQEGQFEGNLNRRNQNQNGKQKLLPKSRRCKLDCLQSFRQCIVNCFYVKEEEE